MAFRSDGRVMKRKPRAQRRRPRTMMGREWRRILRRPMRSMRRRARQVMRRLVRATEREVRVGLEKPRRVKIVAEKYIREFCGAELVVGE